MIPSYATTLAAAGLLLAVGSAQAAPSAAMPTHRVLPVALALEAARVALATCLAQGNAVAVAVMDRNGELQLMAADPDVSPISIALSQRKAHTAAVFKARSVDVGARFKANPAYEQGMASVDPHLTGAQGAVPIIVGGELVGAMGISGAPGGDKDEACVAAGLAAIADRLH
jgi:uncharacterized protein GlcG (DUF336 family)